MIEDQLLPIVGTLGGDPELRFTPSGAAVVNFSVAVNHRYFNKQSGQWEEKGTDWWRCNAWRGLAENIAESFRKGDRVLVVGKVASRQFETREGGKVTTWEVTVEDMGPSVKFATATSHRAERNQAPRDNGQQGGQYNRPASEDPWATPQANQTNYGQQAPQDDPWGQPTGTPQYSGGFADEPPF